MSDYKTIQTDLDAAVRMLMGSVLHLVVAQERNHTTVETAAFVQAVARVSRVAAWAGGLHESHALYQKAAQAEHQAVTCGFVDPPSPEEMEALRNAPSAGEPIPTGPDLASLKRRMLEVARYFTPGYRLRNSMPSTHSGAVYDLLAEAEKLGWLSLPEPRQAGTSGLGCPFCHAPDDCRRRGKCAEE
jgi:hypothetical protein